MRSFDGRVSAPSHKFFAASGDLHPVPIDGITVPSMSRSFVIPVLDLSPHSPYNVRTLLADLEKIEGEVVVIFNNHELGEELKTHPRIDRFAVLSHNTGVSRGWNIGFNLSDGDHVFFLNADLSIQPNAVSAVEKGLVELENAVICGPQGSLIDYSRLAVTRYFGKGDHTEPVQTDDVSGFFFAVHRRRALDFRLQFDIRFSPCFLEEWDFALQARQCGLAAYVVPTTEYDHRWGVSQGARKSVQYFDETLNVEDVLERNRAAFIEKWLTPKSTK